MRARVMILLSVAMACGAIAATTSLFTPLATTIAQTTVVTSTATPTGATLILPCLASSTQLCPCLATSGQLCGPVPPLPTSVTYPSGWQIVGLPQDTVLAGNSGSLWTFKAGDTAYEQIASGTPLNGGQGYWAFFPLSTTLLLSPPPAPSPVATSTSVPPPLPSPPSSSGQQPLTLHLQAGWTMIGNPFYSAMARIGGSFDIAFAYNLSQASGSGYQQVCTLPVGFGAAVYSSRGGTVTLTPVLLPILGPLPVNSSPSQTQQLFVPVTCAVPVVAGQG